MEFKSDEFIKNLKIESEKIQIENEKTQLEKKMQDLQAQKSEAIVKKRPVAQPSYIQNTPKTQSFYQNNPIQNQEAVVVEPRQTFNDELDDIKLKSENDDNKKKKKKFIILTISLSILFVLTIIIIRAFSNDSKQNNLYDTPKTEQIKQDKIIEIPNIDEKYEALINKKANKTIQKELDLKKVVKKETPLPDVADDVETQEYKEPSSDVFGMEKQKVVKKIKKIIKQKPKPIIVVKPKFKPKPKPKPQPKPIEKNTSKAIGSFVQIGAFTKAPDKNLIAKIKSKGYSYIVHKMVIKGRTYNKVLVGPFTNGQPLKNALTKVRKDLNVPKAYILRLK